MEIVQVITVSEPIGGAQMVLFNNTMGMVENGHNVHVIVGNEGILTNRLKKLNVKITCVPSLKREISPVNDLKCYKKLRELLKTLNPDIVISHSSKAGILTRLACKRVGVRNIFTVHGWSFTPGIKGIKRYVYLAVEKIMGKFTDHLIAVSEFDLGLALKNKIVTDSKIKVIYNGSPDLLGKDAKPSSSVINILMTARFSFQKDHMTLFKAIQILKNEAVHVDLVGSGPLYAKFVGLSKEMNIDHLISFHGESNDIPSFLNKADIFVLSSQFEGLPLSICEAMSVGIPVLASDVGGVSEMVKDDYNGYLIPREDYSFLAKMLKRLIQDKETLERLGEHSRKTYLQKFSIDQMTNATEKYITDIIQE